VRGAAVPTIGRPLRSRAPPIGGCPALDVRLDPPPLSLDVRDPLGVDPELEPDDPRGVAVPVDVDPGGGVRAP
jgi:hypothetical protein